MKEETSPFETSTTLPISTRYKDPGPESPFTMNHHENFKCHIYIINVHDGLEIIILRKAILVTGHGGL
jgi:hypothetical protein